MTLDEAIRILDPKTTGEALLGLKKLEAIPKIEEACRIACGVMRGVDMGYQVFVRNGAVYYFDGGQKINEPEGL